jgi:alginate O-acetyltransferase complex protein AlgI
MIQSPVFWSVLLGAVVVHWLLPRAWRSGFLALVSFGYLVTLENQAAFMVILAGWAAAFYIVSTRLPEDHRRRRWISGVMVVGILSYLAFWKYIPRWTVALGFSESYLGWLESLGLGVGGGAPGGPITADDLLLPLGISYFSFKLIHYIAEVARGNITDVRLGRFLNYIFWFPIFTAGPIERFEHFRDQQRHDFDWSHISVGGMRVISGLIKKFVIGDMLIAPQFNFLEPRLMLLNLETDPFYIVWRFALGAFLVMYMDFSGYSDIAIGASRMFGLKIMENFNWPILAPNIGEFWKRWHMTLAGWCQAYVYMPMIGLTRNPYIAIYSTFIVMGLWHAGSWHWVMWGMWHATGVTIYLKWLQLSRKRKWTFLKGPIQRVACIGVTCSFFAAGGMLVATDRITSVWGAIRLVAKLVGLVLPA